MLPRVTRCLLSAFLFLGGVLPPASADDDDVSVERLRDHVAFLASDGLGGRDSGEPGLEVAAEYLASVFSDLGLEPAGDRGSFFQYFTVPYGADFGSQLGVRLARGGDDVERTWAPWTEAFPMGFGESGPVDAPVVFAGYGITTDDEDRKKGLEYDDYADLDVKGKVLVILRFTPRSTEEEGPFGGRSSPHAPFIAKLSLARKLGAAGVVFATPPGETPAGAETKSVENLRGFARQVAPRHPTLPAVLVPTRVLQELFDQAGRSLDETVGEIDSELQPRSFELPGVRLRMDTRRGYRVLRNVAARLNGRGELARETVVIGGHYDHIGRYGAQVARKNFGQIHNGADDNASGIAGILEVARVSAARDEAPARSLLFLCFSGEEIGLLGSRHWVKAPRRFRVTRAASLVDRSAANNPHQPPAPSGGEAPSTEPHGAHAAGKVAGKVDPGTLLTATGVAAGGFLEVRHPGRLWIEASAVEQVAGPEPLSSVVAMVNLDMIGRAKDDQQVTVIGSDTSEVFGSMLDEVSESREMTVRRSRGMRGGGSDHTHFLRRSIPALFFFTGMHRQYNTPEDDLERLNLDGMRRIVSLVAACVQRLRVMPEAPPFDQSTALASSSSHGRPQLGVVVDPRYRGRGARVTEVVEESPAEGAGLQAGDAIVALGGNPVDSYEELVAAIEEVSPGSEVAVKLLRAGETLEVAARFPSRTGRFRVSFGSVPDYAFEERGVRFDDIRTGTAAAEAGVKAGDVLIVWAGKEVEDVTHWTGLLAAHKPGDEVKITVRRGKEKLELTVKLKAR